MSRSGQDGPARLWDPGAQNERTRLAWQRTLLSLTVAALVVARLVATEAMLPGLLLGGVALALGLGMALLAGRRYTAAEVAVRTRGQLPDGRINLVMVLLVLTIGAGAGLLLLVWS
ncbi:DUF202 domain-containing protein [Desertihabitans aurantiacus]|uniref:DUF202 domain-containing protein n=1 Tax=Desertihabitans aurantiacus TaxID=2282477 RepID=UPI000DF7A1F9|nr:DUF202 domain-containing protein [Desertihabitans aurantiacus]